MTEAKQIDATRAEILNALETGEHNAIHQKELAEKVHLNAYELKRIIRGMRKEGFEILSTCRGYFKSGSAEETERFLSMMTKQAATRFASITAFRKKKGD